MKRLLFIILLFCSFKGLAQFPGTDSLRNYNNRWITNSAIQAFTNYRLNTLLHGMIDWIDSARAGEGGTIGVDSIGLLNDSTLRYRKNGVFQSVVIKGGAVYHDFGFTGKGIQSDQLKIDTSLLKTVADAQRVTDSLVALLALKLNISDTSSMLTNYVRRNELQDTAAAIRADFTSTVTTDATLTGDGSGGDPLGIDLTNANTWTGQQTFNTSAPIFGTMTEGSVLYAGSGGVLSQNNSNFFWDNGNTRLGILNNTPLSRLHITASGLGTTQNINAGILLQNTTAATDGNQQISNAIVLRGNGWKTDATAASQTVDYYLYTSPTQGAAAPTGRLYISRSVNGGTITPLMEINNNGIRLGDGEGGISWSGTPGGNIIAGGFSVPTRINFSTIGTPNQNTYTFTATTGHAQTSGESSILSLLPGSSGFNPTSGTATYQQLWVQPLINQTGTSSGISNGIRITPTLTSAVDFRSLQIDNNSHWGVYQSGASAKNYFNGNTLIGTSTDGGEKFQVNGSIAFDIGSDATGDMYYRNSSGTLTRITAGSENDILTMGASSVPAWAAGTPGGGITSLNSETGSSQTFATGTTGTNFNISSSTDVHTFNIPDAGASARGLVTTGTQTFQGQKDIASITFGAATQTAWKPATSNSAVTSDSRFRTNGGNIHFKFGVGGGNNNTLSANNDFASFIVANGGVTEATSGNADLVASAVIKATTVTSGTGTVTNTATLYIDSASDATVSGGNYSIFVDDGLSRYDGNIQLNNIPAGSGSVLVHQTDSAIGQLPISNFVTQQFFSMVASSADAFLNADSLQTNSDTMYTVEVMANVGDAGSGRGAMTIKGTFHNVSGTLFQIGATDVSYDVGDNEGIVQFAISGTKLYIQVNSSALGVTERWKGWWTTWRNAYN